MNESLEKSVLSINSAFAVLLTEYLQPCYPERVHFYYLFPKANDVLPYTNTCLLKRREYERIRDYERMRG